MTERKFSPKRGGPSVRAEIAAKARRATPRSVFFIRTRRVRRKPRRARAVANRVSKDRVGELLALLGAPQHQASAAHVAPADERLGNRRCSPKIGRSTSAYFELATLPSRITGESRSRPLVEIPGVALERFPVAIVARRRFGTSPIRRNSSRVTTSPGGFRPRPGAMTSAPGSPAGGSANVARVCHLSAEVETADEGEQISEARAIRVKLPSQIGVSPVQKVSSSLFPACSRVRGGRFSSKSL